MSILYQRRQPPVEGEQILIDENKKLWRDPRKESSKPLPKLESQKGVPLPSWGQIFTVSTLIGVVATFNHLRLKGKW